MYNISDIKKEIVLYFSGAPKDNSQLIPLLQHQCEVIMKLAIDDSNIDTISKEIGGLRSVYKNTQPIGMWLRMLIFEVIFRYLSNKNHKMKQGEILEIMGLSKDVFSKHWKMYSPDFKVKQSEIINIDNGFARDEVESDKIYLAMLHYVCGYSEIETDTFIDVFGKMGIVPMVCARGYKYRHVITRYSYLTDFQKGLSKPVNVYKEIHQVQKQLVQENLKSKKKFIQDIADQNAAITYYNVDDELFKIAARVYIASYFSHNYWADRFSEMGYNTGKISQEIVHDSVSIHEVALFLKIEKEDIQSLAKLYKNLIIHNEDAKKYLYMEDDEYYSIDEHALLYIDVPKYMREMERYKFSANDYLILLDYLRHYRGNWILVWKNFTGKNAYDLDEKSKEYNRMLVEERGESEKKAFILEGKYKERKDKRNASISETASLEKIYDILYEIHKEQGGLNIFKYCSKSHCESGDCFFITNIHFKAIGSKIFRKKYGIDENIQLVKEDYETFYKRNITKWLPPQYKSNKQDSNDDTHSLKK